MKIPYSWLKEYVDTDLDPDALAEKLTMAGLEVDRVEHRWHKIVTAKIVWKEPIAGSDHLNATRISTGSGPELSVVCGAPNIAAGDIVPLAQVGTEFLKDDGTTMTISKTKFRGVVSEGMLCSPRELGLSSDHNGIFLLPPETPLGQPFDETVIDLDIKAHRGDLFSVTGVAREVAAFGRTRLRMPPLTVPETGRETIRDLLKLTVEDTDLCPRFTARVIRDVKIGPSPLWMVRRLAAAGVRSINNVVDITNYVMLEIGQPLHAFDYDRIAAHHLIIRRAKVGEQVRTLDDQLRDTTADMMLVCDPTGPLSIAGVMGGATSEISDTTVNVLLEAATWNPGNIRRTSTRLGLRSEASSRFEKGLDPELALIGLNRAAVLLADLAQGAVVSGVVDNYPAPIAPRVLHLTPADVEWLLGYPVMKSEAADALTALEFAVSPDHSGDGMTVTVPTWRGDVKEVADLVEEVARVLGYDRIIGTIPNGPLPEPQGDNWFDRDAQIREIMVAAGLHEVLTYPLTSRAAMLQILSDQSDVAPLLLGTAPMPATPTASLPDGNGKKKQKKGAEALAATSTLAVPAAIAPEAMPAITLANALSAKQDTLRLTLLSSVLEILADNVHQGTRAVRIFEVGRRYIPAPERADGLPHERRSLCVALAGPLNADWLGGERPTDFFDLKAIAESLFDALHISGVRYTPTQHPTFHPGRCALIALPTGTVGAGPIGVLGEIHPEVARRFALNDRAYALEIDLEHVFAAAIERVRYRPIARYPALTRDIAIIVDETVAAGDVLDAVRMAGGELLREVRLFDVYTGAPIPAGKLSLAFTVTYQSSERTLIDTDGDMERAKVVRLLSERFGATVRE